MDFENLKLHPPVPTDRIYLSWTEQWDLARYVDHYLHERKLGVNEALRTRLRQQIAKYPWSGPRKKADMDRYLDANSSEIRVG